MESNNWKLATFQPPQMNEDVLVYSATLKGFAIGQLQLNRTWVNSTNGLPFPAGSVTHWRVLPNAPALQGISGSDGYVSSNN